MSARFIKLSKVLFVTFALFAAGGYVCASGLFAAAQETLRLRQVAGAATGQVVLSGEFQTPHPDVFEVKSIEENQNLSVHYDNSSWSPADIPARTFSLDVVRFRVLRFYSAIYTEFENKFLETMHILQTLK